MRLSLTKDDGEVIDLWTLGPGDNYNADIFNALLRALPMRSPTYRVLMESLIEVEEETEQPEPDVDDGVRRCPICEEPNQFGEPCQKCVEDPSRLIESLD